MADPRTKQDLIDAMRRLSFEDLSDLLEAVSAEWRKRLIERPTK